MENRSGTNWAAVIVGLAAVVIGFTWLGENLGREIKSAGQTIIHFGSIGIVLAGIVALAVGIAYAIDKWLTHREQRLTVRAERLIAEATADQAAATAASLWRDAKITTIVAKADEQVFIKDGLDAPFEARHLVAPDAAAVWLAAWKLWNELHTKPGGNVHIGRIEQPMLSAGGPVVMPDLLETIWRQPNILIIGPKNSGKTTLMQHLAHQRGQAEKILILDSHDHPSKWPNGKVIGNGRNYQGIWRGMMALVDLLDKRYKDFSAGTKRTGEFGTVTNMIDEFTLLPGFIKDLGGDIQSYSKPVLTEGRKVDLCAVWGSHSNRVDALGLKGAADLKECFDVVCYLRHVNGERYALVDFGEGIDKETRYRLPGPFQMVAPGYDDLEPIITPAPEPEPDKPTDEEMAILTAFVDVRDNEPKFSYAEVCRRCNLKPGGEQYNRIRNTLRKWGVEPI